MSELIQVDFKRGVITSRQDLEKEPEIVHWVAKTDPDFKGWIYGIAQLAEACVQYGGDWRRMVVVMQDTPPNKESICMTMWDNDAIPKDQVLEALELAIAKVVVDQSTPEVQVMDMNLVPQEELDDE